MLVQNRAQRRGAFRNAWAIAHVGFLVGLGISFGVSPTPSVRPRARAQLLPLQDGRARLGEASLRDVGAPERREARLLARDGLRLFLAAMTSRDDGIDVDAQVRIEQALERFDRAVAVLGDEPEVTLYRALALARFEREEAGGRRVRRTDEAIAEFERVRRLDPWFEPSAVAWELALLRARRREFDDASAEYERVRALWRLPAVPAILSEREIALTEMLMPPPREILAANQGEVEMLAGRLSRARELYEEASARASRGSLSSALALFGLALVQERSGDHPAALDSALAATRAWTPSALDRVAADLVAQHGPTAALHHPAVSFEPTWEIHAYEALAYEALAHDARTSSPTTQAPSSEATEPYEQRAVRSLQAFLASAEPSESPFVDVARRALYRWTARPGGRASGP